MSKKQETILVENIIQWIITHGGYAWKTWGSLFQPRGQPDIDGYIWWKGVCLHLKLEVKTPIGKATELQKYRIEKYKEAGYVAGFITSIKDLYELLEQSVRSN